MTDHPHPDVLGLRASLPAPGWTVVDAARDQRFTGELRAHTDRHDEFRIYFDRGEVYCAERATDPTLGRRLVDAGALNTAQLEYGMLRIGDIEHLGRLFDRVPSINRDAVFVLNQLMTEETVRSAAARSITDVDATPYRHHPSGMHRWSTNDPSGSPAPWGEMPELALPAPDPDARPVLPHDAAPVAPSPATDPTADRPTPDATASSTPSSPSSSQGGFEDAPTRPDTASHDPLTHDLLLDDVVEWNEPSVLVGAAAASVDDRLGRRRSNPSLGTADWVDELGPDGVADAPARPARHARLPPVAVPPVEQFEVIWPSGETVDVNAPDEAASDRAERDDRDGRDARLRSAPLATPPATGASGSNGRTPHDNSSTDRADDATHDADESASVDSDDAAPTAGVDPLAPPTRSADADRHDPDATPDPTSDDALALRRAVATIDTGSLAVRRRLASPGDAGPTPPGRLIVGREHPTAWRTSEQRPRGSVFDAQPAATDEPDDVVEPPSSEQHRRQGALRRLIGSLRRDEPSA